MHLVTSAQMSEIDARAQSEFGIPGIVLMESAAKSAWDHLVRIIFGELKSQRIVFVAGAGNNGGDALVMARYCLVEGRHRPTVLLSKESLAPDAELQAKILVEMGLRLLVWGSDGPAAQAALKEADWIVDGLAGTGLSGPLREPHSEIVGLINRCNASVVAVDAPSGVGDAPGPVDSIVADYTLTLGLPKRCLYDPAKRDRCGRISLIPFTLPSQLVDDPDLSGELIEIADLSDLIPTLPGSAHKGERGKVAVFAGSTGSAGAAVLASRSALSAGAGLVTLFAEESIYLPVASQLTSVMVRPEDEFYSATGSESGRFGAATVGPGWGVTKHRIGQLEEVLSAFTTGVLDADALTLLATMTGRALPTWVLTPHPGELARLTGVAVDDVVNDIFGCATVAAERYQAVVVAKSNTTVIAHPDGRVAVVDGMNPAMGTAGSGDVLSGVIGALLSRGVSAWDAARAGSVLHAAAGRNLASEAGFFRSSSLPDEIGRVLGRALLVE